MVARRNEGIYLGGVTTINIWRENNQMFRLRKNKTLQVDDEVGQLALQGDLEIIMNEEKAW